MPDPLCPCAEAHEKGGRVAASKTDYGRPVFSSAEVVPADATSGSMEMQAAYSTTIKTNCNGTAAVSRDVAPGVSPCSCSLVLEVDDVMFPLSSHRRALP